MDLDVVLPQNPVRLTPGVTTTVPVELRNTATAAVTVQVVARGRAAEWVRSRPPPVELRPGATATVELAVAPPAGTWAGGELVPLTVRALTEESRMAGWATGLLAVTAPDRVTAELTAVPGGHGRFELRLRNETAEPLPVSFAARLDGCAGEVSVIPDAADVPPGDELSATVLARPRPVLVGRPATYVVTVSIRDDTADGATELATVTGTGRTRPRLPTRAAAVLGTVLLVVITAAIVVFGPRLEIPGRERAAPATAPSSEPPVRRPFALLEVFSRTDGGRATAEAARQRLAAAGVPVRLVDSLKSDQVDDGPQGFWVLLHDGFASATDAAQFCERYRAVAPKCEPTA